MYKENQTHCNIFLKYLSPLIIKIHNQITTKNQERYQRDNLAYQIYSL